MNVRRALVLGGGGPIGVQWEAGLLTGLRESGFALETIDVIVGTSAGAIIGAHLGHGRTQSSPKARSADSKDPSSGPPAFFDRSKLDVQALGEIYRLWGAMQLTTSEQVRAIGKVVRALDRGTHDAWIASARASVPPGAAWPERRLCVVAVDLDSGERRVFERGDGVPLERAIAASSAVPGLFPAVEIDGGLYMDGQVWSSSNADLLLPERPEQVLIAVPTNAATGRGIGQHAERMLEQEVAALRAAGCDVRVRTPSSDDAQRMGGNLMDYARGPDAYDVGREAGRAWAAEL
jgi:NTE family protein